jgi:hypothetical protein
MISLFAVAKRLKEKHPFFAKAKKINMLDIDAYIQLLVCTLFVCIQLFPPTLEDMDYYTRDRKSNRLCCTLPWGWYLPIFLVSYGCVIFSIWIALRDQASFPLAMFIIICIEIACDKLWLGAYFRLQSQTACILICIVLFGTSFATTLWLGILELYLGMAFHIPFTLVQLHLLIYSSIK